MNTYEVVNDGKRPAGDTGPVGGELDPISRGWLAALSASGATRERAVVDLYHLLLRVARRELRRRGQWLTGGDRGDRETLAREAADDALLAILDGLDDFQGESRFTTWAYARLIGELSGKLAAEAREPVRLTMDGRDWERLADRLCPDGSASGRMRALRTAVERDLAPLEREVFIAVALHQTRIDELAVALGSNRGAIYQTLLDARRTLRTSLEAAGQPGG